MAVLPTYLKTFRGTDIAKLEVEINNYLVTRNLGGFNGVFNSISIKVSEPGEDQITVEVITYPGLTCPLICITGQTNGQGQSVPCSGNIQPLFDFLLFSIPYANQLLTTAGTPPFVFQVIAGALPDGFIMNSNGFIFSTDIVPPIGTYNFTVQVTDNEGCQATQQFSILVFENA